MEPTIIFMKKLRLRKVTLKKCKPPMTRSISQKEVTTKPLTYTAFKLIIPYRKVLWFQARFCKLWSIMMVYTTQLQQTKVSLTFIINVLLNACHAPFLPTAYHASTILLYI